MHASTFVLALVFPIFAVASPLAWDGAPAYTGATNSANGGSVSGGGGIDLIKILSHNAAPAGTSDSGLAGGGDGGNRYTSGVPAGLGALMKRTTKKKTTSAATAGGSAGGAAYSGAAGTAEGGSAQTDPQLTLLDLMGDNAAPGGTSSSGGALGGVAGSIM